MGTQVEPATTIAKEQQPRPAVALAIALFALLLDAAVETFVSGSTIRWWVAGIIAAYLAVSFLLWKQKNFSWGVQGSTALITLTALMAFTAWLPGGLTDGIRLLGQPTSRVLSAITMVAIVLAAVCLLRSAWLPRWAKFAVGLLALYALLAFGKGLFSGIEYPDLLHGESLWTRLPSWLQGAFLGALIVVPLGLVARAAQMWRAAPGANRTWNLRQVVALTLSILIAVPSVTTTGAFGPQPTAVEIVQPLAKSYQELQEALAGPKPKTPPTPQEIADRLDNLFPMLEAAEKQIPRDTFDPQAIIDRVGKDPMKLFEWVRDNTYFVPYKGLLRGEKGVLMDRLGNSLDRAMLLYALLKYVDQPAQLAEGTLTTAQASDIIAKVRPFPSLEQRIGSHVSDIRTDAPTGKYVDQNHLSAVEIRKALDRIAALQRPIKEQLEKRVVAQTEMVSRLIGPPPTGMEDKEQADEVRAVTDHWWVQWEHEGHWINFDPTLPDAQPKSPLTSAQRTVAPQNYTDIAADLLHSVQIEIVIEVWKNGRPQELPVLRHRFLPAELQARPITVRHVPIDWPRDAKLSGGDAIRNLNSALLAQHEWIPVLSVGDDSFLEASFTDSGNIRDGQLALSAAESGFDTASKAVASYVGAGQIGDIGLKKPAIPEKPSSTLVAEWIDYEVDTPGCQPRRVRRTIFDLLHPQVRLSSTLPPFVPTEAQRRDRAMLLLGKTQLILLSNSFSQDFVSDMIINNWLLNHDAVLDTVKNPTVNGSEPTQQKSALMDLLPTSLYGLCLALRGVTTPSDIYLDRENIFSYHQEFRATRTGIVSQEGFDIIANEVAVSRSAPDVFKARVQQGVSDTNMEALIAATNCAASGNCQDLANTAELVEESHRDHVRWLAVREGSQSWNKAVEVRPRVYLEVSRALSTGYTAIVPLRPVRANGWERSGWWKIDPRGGHTLGIDEDGRGGVEYHKLTAKVVIPEVIVLVIAYALCGVMTCHGFTAGKCFGLPVAEFGLGLVVFAFLGVEMLVAAIGVQLELLLFALEHGPREHEPCGGNNPGPEPSPVPTPADNTQTSDGGSRPTWPPNNPNPGPTPAPQQQNAPPLPWPPGVSAADPSSCWDMPHACQPFRGERGNSQHPD